MSVGVKIRGGDSSNTIWDNVVQDVKSRAVIPPRVDDPYVEKSAQLVESGDNDHLWHKARLGTADRRTQLVDRI